MWIDSYQYQADERKSFDVTDGDHRVRIAKVESQQSKTGNRMIVITLAVEHSNNVPYMHYLSEGEYFNSMASRVFDAFTIQRGNFNLLSWVGKEALAHFDHKEESFTGKDGQTKTVNKARLVYFHNAHNEAQQGQQNVPQGYTQKQTPPQVQQVQQTMGGNFPIF